MQSMKVLTVGAAGESAGLVTRALAARGVDVVGLVHSESRMEQARANGVGEVIVADLNDQRALVEALQPVDAAFLIVPAFAQNESELGVNFVEAASEAGVRRIVFSSVYHPSLIELANHRDKLPVEQAIVNSDMEFTILQPAMFMSQLDGIVVAAKDTGVITGPYSPDSRMSYVDYRDVAQVAAVAFTTDQLVGGTFELASPGMYTRRDIADELSGLLSREVRAEGSVPTEFDSQLSNAAQDGLAHMFRHYDEHGFHGGNGFVLESILDRRPMTVPRYLERLVEAPTA